VFALELLLSGNASVIETTDYFSLVYTDTRSKLEADTLDAVIRFPDNVVMLSDWIVLLNEFRSESDPVVEIKQYLLMILMIRKTQIHSN
jgi:hypothetical protein